MRYSEIAELVELITSVPTYTIVGVSCSKLLYLSDVAGGLNLWSMDLASGGRERLTDEVIHSVAKPRETSSIIVYTSDVSTGRELQKVFYVDVVTRRKGLLADMEPMRVIGIAHDGETIAFSGASKNDASIYLIRRGSLEKVFTFSKGRAFVTDIFKGTVVGFGTLLDDPRTYELFIFDIGTGEFKVYTPRNGAINKNPVIKDRRVLFETNYLGKSRLAILDLDTSELNTIAFTYSDYVKYDPVEHLMYDWLEDERVWVVGKKNGRVEMFIDGKALGLPPGYVNGACVHGGKAYLSISSLRSPWRVLEADLVTGSLRVLIDNDLPEKLSIGLGDVVFAKYKSFDDLEVPAYIVESRVATKPGPTVVYVHGGPWWEVPDMWSPFIAGLVASGFHVIAPNFRGSTGYGEEFRALDIGDPGGGDLEDIVYAAYYAKAIGLADRVAITGYSYGGFMTFLATVKKPNVWICGVAGAGITDWELMRELSDAYFKHFIDILFAGRKELFKDRSAINFVENLKVPLCIIHPQNDSRTPLLPILNYLTKLWELGKAFEVHILPGIGHALLRQEDVAKVLLYTIGFLRKDVYS
ncbi:MAG: prolyl oligopeptidase family serine peptidase [Desulfurococcaceae archaeon]